MRLGWICGINASIVIILLLINVIAVRSGLSGDIHSKSFVESP